MSQILDPLPEDKNDNILCCYVNNTSRMQIARITNIENWYFERVVFPGQRLVFNADPNAILEIHCGMMASAILSDTIPCSKLSLESSKQSQSGSPELNFEEMPQTGTISMANFSERADMSPVINIAV